MKNLIKTGLLICILFLAACSGDDISYPATFVFEANEEIETVIITRTDLGLINEVDSFTPIDVSLCEFFETIQGNQEIESITLLSETEMEIVIDDGSATGTTFTVPYLNQDNVLLEEFGLALDGNDKITSQVCNTLNFAPSQNLMLAESNFCTINETLFAYAVHDYISKGFEVGDTLGICHINKIYKKQ